MKKFYSKKVALFIFLFLIVYFTISKNIYIKFKNYFKRYKGVALCVIAKKENLYIKEFVEHYKNLGIKKIYLYDNNDIDGEDFNIILKEYISSNFIEIKNVRGKLEYQIIAYNNCYKCYYRKYSWFLTLDVDEFLFINKNKSLYDFLTNKTFDKCNSIYINYKEYGDSDLLYYDNRTLSKRFTKFRYINCYKSFTRGGRKNIYIGQHKGNNLKNYCNSEGGIEVENENSIQTTKIYKENAEIHHYITKSLEEFYERLLKGWPDFKKGSIKYQNFVHHRIKYYFVLNKITKYKLEKLSPLIKNETLLNELKNKLK